MVVTILENDSSTRGALRYNDTKVAAGSATVLRVANVPGGYDHVGRVFRRYESNPAINGHMKHLCLHVAVSPGPEDDYDTEKIRSFIDDLIGEIGYSGQPYVVYRHNDIEREHFHIVSPKVDAEGKAIRHNFAGSNWDYYGMRHVVLDLGKRYGFQVEFGKKEPRNSEFYRRTGLFDAAKSDSVYQDLKSIFFDSLKYNYTSEQEFRDVLFHFGVKWTESSYRAGKVSLQGCDRTGGVLSKSYSLERMLRRKGYERYVDRLGNNAREQREMEKGGASEERVNDALMDIAYLMAISRHCFRKSRSSEEYRKLLAESGVGVRIRRADGRYDTEHMPGEILGPVRSISFMVRERRYVCSGDTAQNYLPIPDIEKAEREGHWSCVGERLIRKPLLTREDREEIEAAIIANMRKAGLEIPGTAVRHHI